MICQGCSWVKTPMILLKKETIMVKSLLVGWKKVKIKRKKEKRSAEDAKTSFVTVESTDTMPPESIGESRDLQTQHLS